MKKKILTAGAVATISVAVFLYFIKEKKAEAIGTTGIVEGTEVNLSSKVSGRISEICCKEGDIVNVGNVVVRLESNDLKASVEQATAAVARARADILSTEAAVKNSEANVRSSEAEIKNAEADKELAKVQMDEALRQKERAEKLFNGGLISKADMDLATTSYDSSDATVSAADARLKAATSKRDAAISGLSSSRSLLASARAGLHEADAALKFQEARLKDMEIVSPIAGVVVFKGMETGEVVSPGATILTIVDLKDLWARIDLEETYIGRVRLGDEAEITVNGLPGNRFTGTVAEIGKEADFATQRDVTRGRQDIKSFRVKIKVRDDSGTLKPGMTVMVEIQGRG